MLLHTLKQIYVVKNYTFIVFSPYIFILFQTIPVKGGPLLILEDTCSQEISKIEQADLGQTSDSSICNSIKLESLDGLLSYLGMKIFFWQFVFQVHFFA